MNRQTLTRTLGGVSIIAFGILALLGSLNIINFGTVFSIYWPLLLVWVGLLSFIGNPREFGWPAILILSGILLQFRELEMLNFNVWHLIWPIAIIIIGISILFQKGAGKIKGSTKDTESASAFMSGYALKNQSDDYKGGSISAFMGGIKLDLSKAKIKKVAVLNISAVMGGVELIVPQGWIIKTEITPIMGGIENHTVESVGKDSPTLTIVGTLVMGGVEIKH